MRKEWAGDHVTRGEQRTLHRETTGVVEAGRTGWRILDSAIQKSRTGWDGERSGKYQELTPETSVCGPVDARPTGHLIELLKVQLRNFAEQLAE